MYQSIYDLIHTHIYGSVEMSSDMTLVCTLISTIACLLFIAIPFFIVYKIISFLFDSFYGGLR